MTIVYNYTLLLYNNMLLVYKDVEYTISVQTLVHYNTLLVYKHVNVDNCWPGHSLLSLTSCAEITSLVS